MAPIAYGAYIFNIHKCHCILVGKTYKAKISSMLLGGHIIEWSEHIKYLCIHLVSGKHIKFDVSSQKIYLSSFFLLCFAWQNKISSSLCSL